MNRVLVKKDLLSFKSEAFVLLYVDINPERDVGTVCLTTRISKCLHIGFYLNQIQVQYLFHNLSSPMPYHCPGRYNIHALCVCMFIFYRCVVA